MYHQMRSFAVAYLLFITLLLAKPVDPLDIMSGAAGSRNVGRPVHPVFQICERATKRSSYCICCHCHEAVPNDTTVATTHVSFQCQSISNEKRTWFKQQLRKGFFDDPIAPDELPPSKKQKLGRRSGAGRAPIPTPQGAPAASRAAPDAGTGPVSAPQGSATLAGAAPAGTQDAGPGTALPPGTNGSATFPPPSLSTFMGQLTNQWEELQASQAFLRDGGDTASTSGPHLASLPRYTYGGARAAGYAQQMQTQHQILFLQRYPPMNLLDPHGGTPAWAQQVLSMTIPTDVPSPAAAAGQQVQSPQPLPQPALAAPMVPGSCAATSGVNGSGAAEEVPGTSARPKARVSGAGASKARVSGGGAAQGLRLQLDPDAAARAATTDAGSSAGHMSASGERAPKQKRGRPCTEDMAHVQAAEARPILGVSASFAASGGHSHEMLAHAQRHVDSFDAAGQAMVRDMRGCGWCARTANGGPHCTLWREMRKRSSDEMPPAILANPPLLQLARHPTGAPHYWMCGACADARTGPKRIQKQKEWLQPPIIPEFTPQHQPDMDNWRELMGMLLSLPPGSAMQLSVLQCGVRFAQSVQGYCHALAPGADPDLLSGPNVYWDEDMLQQANPTELADKFNHIIDYLRETNPVVQRYKTLQERNLDELRERPLSACPAVPASALGHTVAATQARDPRAAGEADPTTTHGMSTTMEHLDQAEHGHHARHMMFRAGRVVERGTDQARDVRSDADGVCWKERTSVDAMLFPMLHPGGMGAFRRGESLSDMLQQRMQQMFSGFTLLPEYVLVMYQVEAVASLINGVGESVLFAALQREEERHPELGEAERLSRVAARLVPATIPGSPQYHRQALSDLLAIVQRKGMPSFFLTLTADEASELRWSVVAEYEKLCDKMQWEQGWTWESMPVEMAHLMYDRVQIFLKEHLLHPTNPIIGNVTDYVVRWESQHRGSLHVHILIWQDAQQTEITASQITATRGKYKPDPSNPNNWVPDVPITMVETEDGLKPASDIADMNPAERLFRLVERKQIHSCRTTANGCCRNNKPCRCGFPFKPNHVGTVFDTNTNRFIYPRHNEEDANVVPYHPAILAAWNAHMNIQRVTNTAWSFYVLKYAAKMLSPTTVDLSPTVLQDMGIDGLSPQQAKLAAASVLARAVCPCEAAHIMAGRPLVVTSVAVTYVATHPPEWRRLRVTFRNGARQLGSGTPPLQQYINRPFGQEFDNLTLTQYFENYELRRPSDKSRPIGRARDAEAITDQLGWHVWRLAEPRIIRRPICSPTNPNGSFYYNLLLQHYSFRAESDIICRDGDWFKQCVRKNVFTTIEQLDGMLTAYSEYNLWDTIKLNVLRTQVHTSLEQIQPLAAMLDGDDMAGDAPEALIEGVAAMEAIMEGALADDPAGPEPIDPIQYLKALMDGGGPEAEAAPTGLERAEAEALGLCTPQLLYPLSVAFEDLQGAQLDAVQAVLAAVEEAQQQQAQGPGTPSARPLVLTMQGGPGTGKSTVARALVDHLVNQLGQNVLVTATSATAAQRLGFDKSDTIDATCQFLVGSNLAAMQPDHPKTMALQRADLVVCDEFSLMDQLKLSRVTSRLSQATAAGASRKVLLLVGDAWQLPPCGCRHKLDEETDTAICPHCHLLYSDEFLSARHQHLQAVWRQAADPTFTRFLNHVRTRRPTAEYIQEVLGACMRPREELASLLTPDATILCTHREDVRANNETVLQWHHDQGLLGGPVYKVHMWHNAPGTGPAVEGARRFINKPNFHELTSVAVGARIVYHTTDNKKTGATNSQLGVVTKVVLGSPQPGFQVPPGEPYVASLRVRLQNGKDTTVSRVEMGKECCAGVQITRSTFPIQLAYALTAHRAQGCTLPGTTIIDARNSFCPALLYVMLSRATHRDNVFVLGGLKPEDFAPIMPSLQDMSPAQQAGLPPKLHAFLASMPPPAVLSS